jgi:hypothetical protein
MLKKIISQLFLFFIIVHFYDGASVTFPTATKYEYKSDLFYSIVIIQRQYGPFTFEITKMNTTNISFIEVIK